jgi:hypothetical protein
MGFDVAERELGGGVRKDVTKVRFKMVQMRITGVFLGQKADADGIEGVKFVLFEADSVFGEVGSENSAPGNVGVAGRHAEDD